MKVVLIHMYSYIPITILIFVSAKFFHDIMAFIAIAQA